MTSIPFPSNRVCNRTQKKPNRLNFPKKPKIVLRNTTEALRPASTEAAHEVIRRISTESVPAICADALGFLLSLGDFLFELGGAGVDELELGELGVEDADDLCQLRIQLVIWQGEKCGKRRTGSSGLPVLLSVCDVLLISSIISVRSRLSSLSLSESFSASL
jgi:hypothetical protein